MNPVVKIISTVIAKANSIIAGMDRRTVETIKQSFYFLSFVIVIIAIILGYYFGKRSVKRGGKPLAENTNHAFEIYVKRNREKVSFRSLLTIDTIREINRSDLNKLRFHSREILAPEDKDGIVDSDESKRRISPSGKIVISDKLAEIDRTDDTIPISDVKKIKRKESPIKEKDRQIIKEPIKKSVNDKNPTMRNSNKKNTGRADSDKKIKASIRSGSDLKQMEKDTGVIDK